MSRARDFADLSSGSGQITIEGSGSTRQLVITDDDVERLQLYHIGNNSTIESSSSGSNSTNLIFKTSSSGTETERLRIQSAGGISFNGDTAAANALDDYEEGTWTPTIVRSSSNPSLTYSYNHGTYVKIGRLVYYHFLMIVTAVSSNGSGNSRVAGIPYPGATSTSVYAQVGQIGYNDVWTSDVGSLFAQSDGFQIINTGVTQGNLGQNPTTGYFAGAGWYTT